MKQSGGTQGWKLWYLSPPGLFVHTVLRFTNFSNVALMHSFLGERMPSKYKDKPEEVIIFYETIFYNNTQNQSLVLRVKHEGVSVCRMWRQNLPPTKAVKNIKGLLQSQLSRFYQHLFFAHFTLSLGVSSSLTKRVYAHEIKWKQML